ncbi:DUF3000 family protein [Aeromicrobium sp. 636]|uniref:DUF3000 domain-containing protein n=1 Tax=Aeromicrobium senzhongii TaxID=2663859 RepID=A0A8I0ETJ9_9ACTN|nr:MULTISPECIES: DUF3000 domain-containing protein [Aeromicrobium]MBC9225348.1 DUF3000 domain-containing protein [Aeromicrobium senzhongii]MCQ3997458.1 DUF3000 family protein [Aeromicrobium sp. 636]MTB87386.1 DUF3000 family protein [Aeromicrobium senzhongii]QNL95556.1 DUF3000 domain-containing protein [Aeromicrobium senzhongii]
MGARTKLEGVPAPFTRAVEEIERAVARPELELGQMPAPQRIAPFAHAITADVVVADTEVGTGRFILLHDPAGNDAWNGTFRCVTFARADIEHEMAIDPLITQVGWSWLTDALGDAGAEHTNTAGSITVVRSEGFGAMAEDESDAQIEVRASWTPHGGLDAHASAWMELLGKLAGLPPLAPGVVPLNRRRTSR